MAEEAPTKAEEQVIEEPVEEADPALEQEPEKPVYGSQRYDIVDEVLAKIQMAERAEKLTPVDAAAHRAQAPYLTTSMKDLGDSYQGPPKYLSQRDAPLEIPIEVIKSLFCAVD